MPADGAGPVGTGAAKRSSCGDVDRFAVVLAYLVRDTIHRRTTTMPARTWAMALVGPQGSGRRGRVQGGSSSGPDEVPAWMSSGQSSGSGARQASGSGRDGQAAQHQPGPSDLKCVARRRSLESKMERDGPLFLPHARAHAVPAPNGAWQACNAAGARQQVHNCRQGLSDPSHHCVCVHTCCRAPLQDLVRRAPPTGPWAAWEPCLCQRSGCMLHTAGDRWLGQNATPNGTKRSDEPMTERP
jgi:hypothetical protein